MCSWMYAHDCLREHVCLFLFIVGNLQLNYCNFLFVFGKFAIQLLQIWVGLSANLGVDSHLDAEFVIRSVNSRFPAKGVQLICMLTWGVHLFYTLNDAHKRRDVR